MILVMRRSIAALSNSVMSGYHSNGSGASTHLSKPYCSSNQRLLPVPDGPILIYTCGTERSVLMLRHCWCSANKMLDDFNTERYSILFSKYVKITAPNQGIFASGAQAVGSGIASGTPGLSRATRIVKFYISGSKFVKSQILQYENGLSQVKFFH